MQGTKNATLRELWFNNEKLKKVLDILAKIGLHRFVFPSVESLRITEYVVEVPAQLDLYLKRKQFLHCVKLLQVGCAVRCCCCKCTD